MPFTPISFVIGKLYDLYAFLKKMRESWTPRKRTIEEEQLQDWEKDYSE